MVSTAYTQPHVFHIYWQMFRVAGIRLAKNNDFKKHGRARGMYREDKKAANKTI